MRIVVRNIITDEFDNEINFKILGKDLIVSQCLNDKDRTGILVRVKKARIGYSVLFEMLMIDYDYHSKGILLNIFKRISANKEISSMRVYPENLVGEDLVAWEQYSKENN